MGPILHHGFSADRKTLEMADQMLQEPGLMSHRTGLDRPLAPTVMDRLVPQTAGDAGVLTLAYW